VVPSNVLLFASFFSVTLASGMTAPDLSATVPAMEPAARCANAGN
jgi:hypothetical protein